MINIASIDGVSVNPQETYSYAASKAGLIHLTRRMALRLIQDNIVVSAIAPGAFASDMNRDARDHGDEVAQRIPARRIGRDEDMAGAAIYLASRAGDYVVGTHAGGRRRRDPRPRLRPRRPICRGPANGYRRAQKRNPLAPCGSRGRAVGTAIGAPEKGGPGPLMRRDCAIGVTCKQVREA